MPSDKSVMTDNQKRPFRDDELQRRRTRERPRALFYVMRKYVRDSLSKTVSRGSFART